MKKTTLLIFLIFLWMPRMGHSKSIDFEGLTITSLQIAGNSSIDNQTILNFIPFQSGDEYSEKDNRLTNEMLKSLYRNKGYLEVKIQTEAKKEKDTLIYDIYIDEGPLYSFGETHVFGLTTLPERLVQNELSYKSGSPYDRTQLLNTQSRLYLTGLLEDIQIQTSTTTEKTADVTIRVKQKNLKWIKGGVGWGSEEQERVTLILNHKNVWKQAHEIELLGTVSRIWREYKLDYINPYFFNTRTEQRVSLSWRSEDREGHDFERILGSLGLGRELMKNIRGSVAYQVKKTITFNVDPEIVSISPERSDGRSLVATLNRNTTNDPFYPTWGSRSRLQLQRSGGALGGNIDFNKVYIDVRTYEHIWGPFTGAMALRGGVIQEFDPSQQVPIFERFFMGGANSVRGYKERDVGPQDSLGSPLGGEWLFGSSVELRFPLFWKFTWALFVDGGQVGPKPNNVDISKWKFGGGGGIRFKTPVGPIRLDYGYKLNRDVNDIDPWRIHFSLGESF